MLQAAIHFWDMDHTIIDNDCDVSWKMFLIRHGLAPNDAMRQADAFYEQYKRGELQIAEFCRFQLAEFIGRSPAEMAQLARDHYHEDVAMTLYPAAARMIRSQIDAGLPVVLLTATNDVVARPVAEVLGIHVVIGTAPALRDGRYTGEIVGPYCGGAGKLEHLAAYCQAQGFTLKQAAYYGDSKADIPVLGAVGFPVACNPMPDLALTARQAGWPICDFHENEPWAI